jgi:hypothetical protein
LYNPKIVSLRFALRKFILTHIPHRVIRLLLKKANINYLLFGASKKNVGHYLLNNNESFFTLYGMEEQLGSDVVEGFRLCYKEYKSHPGLLRKYVLLVHDCIIEPIYGWGITAENDKLVFDSISNNSWIETYHPSYLQYKKAKASAIHIEEAVSINILKGGENNYWHFLHDLLGEVIMAKKNIPGNIPFIISKTLFDKPYFKQALLHSEELNSYEWIVRENEYYYVKKAWFIQTMPNSNEQFFALQELLKVPDGNPVSNRKVFLTRSSKRIRFLQNSKEIEEIAAGYGFEIIDTDGLSLQEQIKLFSEIKWLIAIHGAGLTNVFYRKNAPMYVLELLPKDYLQPHYFWLSKGMGHYYDCLEGTASSINTSFEILCLDFENKMKDWASRSGLNFI